MKNNAFVKSTLILLVGGSITKVLGFILKIVITRLLGPSGIGLYSILMPTYNLLMTISICSYPVAISKVVSESENRSKNILLSIIPVSIIINIITIFIVIIFARTLSVSFLNEERLYYPIIICSLTLPFISLSSIVKGHFWGKQKMFPYMVSNVCEQIFRMIILLITLPKVINYGIVLTICLIIGVNIFSESFSIFIMLLFIKKNTIFNIKDIHLSKDIIDKVYSISIPSTLSKSIGSIFFFLEPIILTNTLLRVGYDSSFITLEYGIINGYALSLLMLPSFFTQSISTSLVPELSKNFKKGNKKLCRKRVKQIVLLSLSIGVFFTSIILMFPKFFLNTLYGTSLGIKYIRILGPFTLLYYINSPVVTSLQALNKSKTNMVITLISSSIKLLLIYSLSLLKIGLYPLIIGIIFNLVFSTFSNMITLKKALS